MLYLELLGRAAARRFPLKPGTTIGCGNGCTIRAQGGDLQEIHCWFYADGPLHVVETVDCAARLLVNGREVTRTTLRGDDRIVIGSLQFLVVEDLSRQELWEHYGRDRFQIRSNYRPLDPDAASAPSAFIEPHPALIATNPGGPADPLGESILDPANSWLRVFAPTDVRVVIGRHQDPQREVLLAHAKADQVPVHRRASGGGAVVLAPGMVVVAVRLRPGPVPGRPDPQPPFAISGGWPGLVNHAIAAGVHDVTGITPTVRGLGDLAISDGGAERKILGSSLRQTARLIAYLGVLLVDDATALMDRLLQSPSREPDYRGGRDHGRFCTHLSRLGATTPALVEAVEARLARDLSPWAAPAAG